MEFSKKILISIAITYFIAFFIATIALIYNIIHIGTSEHLPAYLTFVAIPTNITCGFYFWKAKSENIIKISQNVDPEIVRIISETPTNILNDNK